MADFAGERVAARVVRHHRQERLAAGGVPALLGQRHVRRCRHGGVGEVPAAALRREAGSEVQAGARQGDRVRPRQPVSDRRLAAALSAAARVRASRQARLHVVPDLQRRRRRREHRLPGACATRRSAIARLLDADHARHERVPRHAAGAAAAGLGAAVHARSEAGRRAHLRARRRWSTHTTGDATSSC